MFFGKKDQAPPSPATQQGAPPPPWENIDETSKRRSSTASFRFNLTGFVAEVTGFSSTGTKILLIGFAASLGFVAYIAYVTIHESPPLPPEMGRPAIDARASSTPRLLPNNQP